MTERLCPNCGTKIDGDASRCYKCQSWITDTPDIINESEPQDFLSTVLFAYFLGMFGIHRFWTGYIAIGVAQLLTFGGCGIWAVIDIISISLNKYKDAQGRQLQDYNRAAGITIFLLTIAPICLLILFFIALGVLVHGTTP